MSMSDSKSVDIQRTTTRRAFLKTAGAAVLALVGGNALVPTARGASAAVPVWSAIPAQSWSVGVPVQLDLANYCSDADGNPLTFTLDRALPPGLTLTGSVISGTPTQSFSATQFIATADDGSDTIPPAAPANLREK